MAEWSWPRRKRLADEARQRLKDDVLHKAMGNSGYWLPQYFVCEVFDTPLHQAIRELHAEHKLKPVAVEPNGYERWEVA